MAFLIGVTILIAFVCFSYLFLNNKLDSFKMKYFGTTNIRKIIEEAKIEDQEIPKSLSSMDSIYLEQIIRDFPEMNINELKRECEKVIIDVFKAIEKGDSSIFKAGKIKSFVEKMILDNSGKKIKYRNLKIHKTVVSKYENCNGIVTIYFGTSFEYILDNGSEAIRTQDRARLEYIYIVDVDKVNENVRSLGLSCPNCGAPIKSLGKKTCGYCKSGVVDLVKKSWACNDLKLY